MESSLRVLPPVVPAGTTGVILAIDYGQKRLGLALSDAHGVTARPFAIWTRINRRRDLARLRDLVRKERIRYIIVGLPLHLNGTPSEMSEEVTAFAMRVEKALGVRVEMMDERLSSWEARQTLTIMKSGVGHASSRKTSGKEKSSLDDIAAAIILRDYLDRVKLRLGSRD